MCVSVAVCVSVCTCPYACAYVTAYVSMCVRLRGYVHAFMSAHLCLRLCMSARMHLYMHACTDLRCAGAGSAGSPGGPGTLALPDSQLWRRNGESERLEARTMADVPGLSGRWSFPSSSSPPIASRPSPPVQPLPGDGGSVLH